MGIMVSEVYEALIAAGAPEDKAKAAAEAIPVSDLLATREDMANIRQDIVALKAATQQDIAGIRQLIADLRAETRQLIADLRAETRQDIADSRAATKQDIAKLENRLIRLELAVYGGGTTVLALLIKLTFFS